MSESGGVSWGDLWDDSCGVSDCVSGTGTSGPVVPVVTDVLVSPSSVVTECLEMCPWRSIGNLSNRSLLLSPRSAVSFGQLRRKR